jgi:hypothetical protein
MQRFKEVQREDEHQQRARPNPQGCSTFGTHEPVLPGTTATAPLPKCAMRTCTCTAPSTRANNTQHPYAPTTSCAIKERPGAEILPRRVPSAIWVQVWELVWARWVWSGGSNLAPGPLGSVAGDPDRHRGWLLCPSAVPAAAAAGRGLRPRVFSAHGPGPQLQDFFTYSLYLVHNSLVRSHAPNFPKLPKTFQSGWSWLVWRCHPPPST